MKNDIANLLRRFGADAKGYLEIENSVDYIEPPQKPITVSAPAINHAHDSANDAVKVTPIPAKKRITTTRSVATESKQQLMVERAEPVMGNAPSVTAPASVSSSSLRALLGEAALKRQAENNALKHEAGNQSFVDGMPSVTPARVIAVVSPKGGVGKTTLCAALADTLIVKGRAIAIDLDPQNALQYHMGASANAASEAGVGLTGEGWSSLLLKGTSETSVLPYGMISEEERRAFERCLEEDEHWLAKRLVDMNLDVDDVVVLDTPPGRTLYLDQALDVADQVIVVVTPDAGSFMALDQIDRLLEGHPDCSYIVNQLDAGRTFCLDMLEVLKQRLGNKLIGVIPLNHAISEGLAFGTNPLVEDEESPERHEILSICNKLNSNFQASVLADGIGL